MRIGSLTLPVHRWAFFRPTSCLALVSLVLGFLTTSVCVAQDWQGVMGPEESSGELPSFDYMMETLVAPTELFHRGPDNPREDFSYSHRGSGAGALRRQEEKLRSSRELDNEDFFALMDDPQNLDPYFSFDLKTMLARSYESAFSGFASAIRHYAEQENLCSDPFRLFVTLGQEIRAKILYLPHVHTFISADDVQRMTSNLNGALVKLEQFCGPEIIVHAKEYADRFAFMYLDQERGCRFNPVENPSLMQSYDNALRSLRNTRAKIREVAQIEDDEKRWRGAAQLNREAASLWTHALFVFEMNLLCSEEKLSPRILYDLYAELSEVNRLDNELGYLFVGNKKYSLWMQSHIGLEIIKYEIDARKQNSSYGFSYRNSRFGVSVLSSINDLSSFTYYVNSPDIWAEGLFLYIDFSSVAAPLLSGEGKRRLLLFEERGEIELCRFSAVDCKE